MNRLTAIVAACCGLVVFGIAIAATLQEPCCAVIGVDAVKGTVSVRSNYTGRVMQVKSADLAKTLKVGDAIDADAEMKAVTSVKGVARTAALVEPDYVEPCCSVVTIAKDKAIANALLSGVVTTGGKPYDAVAPFHGIIVAKDKTTGAFHVLDTSVMVAQERPTGATASPMTMSKTIDEIKVDDPIWINGKYGAFKSKRVTYAFKLRGAETDGGPWVIEPDSEAVGRYGVVRTNWHEKSSSNHQSIKVYLPGKRDADEYHEVWKTKHSVMEGEYDIMINGMVLEKVPIKAGHATRILMGALRSTAPYAQQLHIMDTKDRAVRTLQGGETVALPIGTYHLKVGTRTVKVEVKENELTEF